MRGVSVSTAKQVAGDFAGFLNYSLPYDFHIRAAWRDIYGVESTSGGAYHPAESADSRALVTIAAGNHASPAAIQRTLQHEILGHMMLNTYTPQQKAHVLNQLIEAKDSPSLAPVWDKVNQLYNDKSIGIRAEEVFCHIAENTNIRAVASPGYDPLLISASAPTYAIVEAPIAYKIECAQAHKLQFQTFPDTDVHSQVSNVFECRQAAGNWLQDAPQQEAVANISDHSRPKSPQM